MAPVSLDWQGAGATSIRLYDVAGRRVRTLALERAFRGTAQWDGRDESGSLVPAGVYLARLIGGSLRAQTRVVLLP
jgi:flagellar hook assembly protein FlgD